MPPKYQLAMNIQTPTSDISLLRWSPLLWLLLLAFQQMRARYAIAAAAANDFPIMIVVACVKFVLPLRP